MQTWTRQQLVKLAEEATALAEWTTVRDFAAQVYGPDKAVKVEIETHGEYNDEGGTDYSVAAVTAYDKDGNELTYDLTLPFWTQSGIKESLADKDPDDILEVAQEELKEWYVWKDEDKAQIAQHGWIQWEDLPCDIHEGEDETYDLTVMPALTLPS